MKARVVLIALSFVLYVLGSPVLAGTCGGAVQCQPGDTLTSDQVMWYDLIDCTTAHGLYIQDDNITLDGNGHTIDGIDTDPSFGVVVANAAGVTIKNLTVTDFNTGIDMYYGDLCNITSNTVSSCKTGISARWADDNQFADNSIVDNVGGSAIGFYVYACTGNTITYNTISNSSWRNMDLRGATQNNTIYGNRFSGCPTNATAQTDVINNDWNVCGVGNYWHNFTSNSGYPWEYVIDGTGDGVDYFPQYTTSPAIVPDPPANELAVDAASCSTPEALFPYGHMNAASLNSGNVKVRGCYSGPWNTPFVTFGDGPPDTLSVICSQVPHAGEVVTVQLTDGVQCEDGGYWPGYQWQYTAAVDPQQPGGVQ
ncbi:MAG: NosD domain-containing protein [bacterium]